MHLTRVFVSSTCYDLSALRESLRSFLNTLGHEPVLSEYPSFPVRPDETAISNCRLNVKQHCDIFVLIVGGRRGFLDQDSGKSVTNLEFLEAKATGKACFVFINRTVLDLLPIWKKNPTADFTPQVDYPEVFAFIESIQKDNQWTFGFSKTQEIRDILSIQLSGFFRTLLERQAVGGIDRLSHFSHESELARALIKERPDYWGVKLAAELFRDKLSKVRERFEKAKTGRIFVAAQTVEDADFLRWAADQFANSITVFEALKPVLADCPKYWGQEDNAGDPVKILESTNEVISFAIQAAEWEITIRTVRTSERFEKLRSHLSGALEGVLTELEKLPTLLLAPFAGGAVPPDGTHVDINLTLPEPELSEFHAELQRLNSFEIRRSRLKRRLY